MNPEPQPIVLIQARDGEISHAVAAGADVPVVLLDWDRLEEASQGGLCRAYKAIWGLPADLREGPLAELIGVVQRRCPIMATFHPQRWEGKHRTVPDGPPTRFDATGIVLRMDPDAIDSLRDRHYPVGVLAAGLPARRAHDGPFDVDIKEAAMEFLYADENEAGRARLEEGPDHGRR